VYAWISSLSQRFKTCACEEHATETMQDVIGDLGFYYFSFAVRSATPFVKPMTKISGTYPLHWVTRYLDLHHSSKNELIAKHSKSSSLVIWDHRLLAGVDRTLSDEAVRHGLKYGCTLTLRDFNNSLLTFSVARPLKAISASEAQELALKLRVLIEVFSEGMDVKETGETSAREPLLTERERQILQWTAEGKSSAEVAIILSICADTVNYHLNNVKNKLGVPNKTSAVAYGVALGLL
jgi:LuxR family transcriptional regulator, quorum-sensing system regulator RhlR